MMISLRLIFSNVPNSNGKNLLLARDTSTTETDVSKKVQIVIVTSLCFVFTRISKNPKCDSHIPPISRNQNYVLIKIRNDGKT